jgi:GTPase SAR1 family protein
VCGRVCCQVLDTAGQEEYTALRDQWIRDGEGFVLVYSIISRSTFERIPRVRGPGRAPAGVLLRGRWD